MLIRAEDAKQISLLLQLLPAKLQALSRAREEALAVVAASSTQSAVAQTITF